MATAAGRPVPAAGMKPVPHAIEAMHALQPDFDLYILAYASWKNPSEWSGKVERVTRYLDDVFHERLLLTPGKHLCKGDYLIDTDEKKDVNAFEGEWIRWGSPQFPDWQHVVDYLRGKIAQGDPPG